MKKFALFAGLAAAASIGFATPALAHAKLMSSNPANNAVLHAAPGAITLQFSERVVPAFTTVQLAMPEHGMQLPVQMHVDKNGTTVTAKPAKKLVAGTYRIVWTAATSDGHKMSGNVDFKVG